MRKMLKKALSAVLSVALLVSGLTFGMPEKVFAAGTFSKVGGWNEMIYAEITGVTDSQVTAVSYSGTMSGSLTGEDLQYLVRDVNGHVRIDIPGVKAGTYTLTVETTQGTYTQSGIAVNAYDRSGYAFFNYTEGVGAYNPDGTIKDNAIVIYVTDETKNTVTLTYGGNTVTGIGNILNSVGMKCHEAGHEDECKKTSKGKTYYGKGNGNEGILHDLATANVPLVVRFVGIVSESGLYQKGTYSAAHEGLIDGLTDFNCNDYGGSEGDNGHMARMKDAKNVTLEGIGTDATIDGWGIHFMATSGSPDLGKNFEVRNLTFINTPEDAIGMEGTQSTDSTSAEITGSVERCWVHNNEFYCPAISGPAESDKGQGDGSCDFKRGRYFTCSYNYFEGCHKTNLVGSSKTSLQYSLSYHHNYWKSCESRGPLSRNANQHFYNNIYENQSSYCMDARAAAFIFSEYNLFYQCKSPHTISTGEGPAGVIKSYNDWLASCIEDDLCTAVTDKSTPVPNSCQYISGKIDYSQFELDSNLSYIPSGNYQLQTDAETLKKVIKAYSGVMPENPVTPEQVKASQISYVPSGVTPVNVTMSTTTPYTVSPGKISAGTNVYAFTVPASADITVDMTNAVLINEFGQTYLSESGTVRSVPAGTYIIQAATFDAKSGKFKDCTVSSISILSADPSYDPTILKGIKLNEHAKTLLVDGTLKLSVTYEPVTATGDKTVTWSSDKPEVAKVENGLVTALSEGTAVITAKVGDFTDTCTVTVSAPVELAGIKINETAPTVKATKTITLTASATNDTTEEFTVEWSSADPSVATVNPSTGVVTGVKVGTVDITATAKVNGVPKKTAKVTVTVTEAPPVDTSGMVHNFTEKETTSTFYTISGNISEGKGTVTYDGLTLTKCLKMESATSIDFTAPSDGKLTLVFKYDSNNAAKAVKYDGTVQAMDSSGIVNIDVKAGTHKLTKSGSTNLFYMALVTDGSGEVDKKYTAQVVATGLTGATASLSKTADILPTDSVTLTITPDSGYTFAETPNVTADNAKAGNVVLQSDGSYKCIINGFTGNTKVTVTGEATEKTVEYDVTIDSTDLTGAKAAADKTKASSKDQVVVTITPEAGKEFKTAPTVTLKTEGTATVGAVTKAAGSDAYTCKVTNVKAATTLVVKGAATEKTVTVKVNVNVENDGNGKASADKTQAEKNTTVKLTAVPNAGYSFEKWVLLSGTGAVIADSTAAATTLTVGTSDVSVKATFKKNNVPADEAKVRAFVTRLYTVVLNRQPDEDGINAWTQRLVEGSQNGATTSYGFVFSEEFQNRNISNSERVDIMYRTFLDREADAEGKKMWVDALDSGVGIEKIYEGFVMSTEFAACCAEYGISAGQMSDVPGMIDKLNLYRNRNLNVTAFVARCYTKALGRERDIDGIEMWCRLIITGEWTPRNVAADGFFHSDEFKNKNTTNAQYVSILYETFLGRTLDAEGNAMWVGLLDRNEWTRDEVLDGFANSDEFAGILASFGLN